MKWITRFLIITAAIFLGANTVQAAPVQWEFDQAHSNVFFEVRHIYSTARGTFPDISGTFVVDEEKPENSKFDLTVDVKTIDTNIGKRDNHLRSPDFFDVGKFPVMKFVSEKVVHKEGNQYDLTGNLTVKDVTRKITVPVTFLGVKENPVDKDSRVAGFNTEFEIDRLEYNVGNGKFLEMGLVGRTVKILVSLEMVHKK